MRAPRILCRIIALTLLSIFYVPSDAAVELITRLHSTAAVSESADGPSGLPQISADGRYVLFTSGANNLISNNLANLWISHYIYDRLSNTLMIASSTNGAIPARGDAFDPSLSADGRTVLFSSTATNLGYVDRFSGQDIFQKSLDTGDITLINAVAFIPSLPTRGWNLLPSMTPDGAYVLFQSDAPDAAPTTLADTLGFADVYVRDVASNRTHLISRRGQFPNQISAANQASTPVAISTNGNFVLFYSLATDLVVQSGQPIFNVYTQRVWLRDLTLQQNILVSYGATNGNRESASAASMDPNATVVAFAGNGRLDNVSAPANHTNVYAWIRATDTLKTMPLPLALKTNLFTAVTYVSPDAARVALTITPRVSNTNQSRLLIWDLASDAVADIDLAQYGATPGFAVQPHFIGGNNLLLSGVTNSHTETITVGMPLNIRSMAANYLSANADGSIIAFSTYQALVPGDLNNESDVYVMTATGVELISKAHPRWKRPLPDMSIHHLQAPNAATDKFAFTSFSDALVANDTNGFSDIFTWSKSSGEVKLETITFNGPANAHSLDPALSADGRWLTFISFASNLVPNDTNKTDDIFLKSLDTGEIIRVSEPIRVPSSRILLGVRAPVISETGRYVAYFTTRSEMRTNNLPAGGGLLAFDRTTGEQIWVTENMNATLSTRPVAIYEPNLYFYYTTNLHVMNLVTRERQMIGPSNVEPAFTSDGSLVALHAQGSGGRHVYTFDPATRLTNTVYTWNGIGQFNLDRIAISDNKIISFQSHVSLNSADIDNTNDVYTVSAANSAAAHLVTTRMPFQRGSETFVPRSQLISRDGSTVFYLLTTNSPIDLVPRTDLIAADVVSGATASITAGSDYEPAPHSTSRPILVGNNGLAALTTARDLVESPFDKANLIFHSTASDTDNDTLSDFWEQAYFGSLEHTGSADFDNDGASNTDEMLAGTDPRSATSLLALRVFDFETYIELWVRDATLRPTSIQYTEDLNSGAWLDLNVEPLRSEGNLIYRFNKQPNTAFFRIEVQP